MNNPSLFSPSTSINLIVKTAGNACNINCMYCFEKDKHVSNKFISCDTLEKMIEKVSGTCTVVFHGGEPLIVGKDYFEGLLNTVEKYYPQKITAIRVQTNGTLLTEDWIQLIFHKYKHLNIEIAISLDGTFEMNRLRVDNNNLNTFDDIIHAFNLLDKHGIKAGMLSVISKNSLKYSKEYIELIDSISNIKFVKINALFNIENNQLTGDSITPSEYAKFIIETSEWYIKSNLYKRLPIEPFLSILQRINNKKSKYCNYSARKCFNYLSVYPDGSIGPCDCFSVNDFNIELNTGSLDEAVLSTVNSEKCSVLNKLLEECSDCSIKDFCLSGCLSQRYYFNNNFELKADFCNSKHLLYNAFNNLKLK